MKSDNFEKVLPEGYELKLHIDAKNKKTAIFYMILSLLPLVVIVAAACLIIEFAGSGLSSLDSFYCTIALFAAVVAMIAYVILHELVHGITYKALTGGKLTFGLRWNVAFCGVPDIYVYRKAAKLAVLMPFLVFNVVFVALTVGMYFVNECAFLAAAFVFGMHLGGCMGDLHVTYMLDHKFKDSKTLMRDTGPEQFFYVYTGIEKAETEK
ncbi:MAG: DUF3267 domain-containing protein [Clostridia bacterium]|nr:DUF3267 domain-containing protein [Clostridia bacterium]